MIRKIIQILSIIIACVIVIALILPFAFRGKIDDLIKKEGHKVLNAEFDFKKLDISIFKNFPTVSVTLEDFWLKGVDEFSNDTLVYADGLTAGVNLFSFLSKGGFEITKVELSNSTFNAIVLTNGKTNWDILKTDTTTIKIIERKEKTKKESKADSTYLINLDQFVIKNMNVIYDNRNDNLHTSINNFNLLCSGNFSGEKTVINLQGGASFVTLQSHGVTYLSNATISTEIALDADFVTQMYKLKENEVIINAITTSFGGWFSLGDSIKKMDIHLTTNEVNFKDILSLIPSIYSTDFEQLQTEGTAKLSAYAKGDLIGDSIIPAFNLTLDVNNGLFKYPSLPAGINDINILAIVDNPGGPLNKTSVSLNPFNFNLGGNPFSFNAQIKTIAKSPEFDVNANGTLNLAMINQVFPIEGINLNGTLNTNLNISGMLSYIEKKQYNKINAIGTVRVNDMKLNTTNISNVEIDNSLFTFTPQYLQLSETKILIGNNDLSLDSKFENYLDFALNNGVLKGHLNVHSNNLNLNDFMSPIDTIAKVDIGSNNDISTGKTDKQAATILLIPNNIDFEMNANFKKVQLKQMNFESINGKISIKDSKVDMSNLSMKTMGGSIVINGSYDTQNPSSPKLKTGLRMHDINFAKAYTELEMVKQMAPIFENLKGDFSGSMNLETLFDTEMNPVLDSLQANGKLTTRDLSLSGVKIIDDIADAIKQPNLKEMKVKDMSLDFIIKDGRLQTEPFDIKLGDYSINLSGTTGLDQSIDYMGKIKVPSSAGDLAKLGTVNLKIEGTFNSPKLSIDTSSMLKQAAESIGDKAMKEIGKQVGLDSTTIANPDSLKNKVKEKAVEKALDFLKKL